MQTLAFWGILHPIPWTSGSFQPLLQGHLVPLQWIPWPAPNPMFIQWRCLSNLSQWLWILTSSLRVQYITAVVWLFLSKLILWCIKRVGTNSAMSFGGGIFCEAVKGKWDLNCSPSLMAFSKEKTVLSCSSYVIPRITLGPCRLPISNKHPTRSGAQSWLP